jgi:hypothetical protein
VFVDTGRPPPDDIHADGTGPPVDVDRPLDRPDRSLLVLVANAAAPQPAARATVPKPG